MSLSINSRWQERGSWEGGGKKEGVLTFLPYIMGIKSYRRQRPSRVRGAHSAAHEREPGRAEARSTAAGHARSRAADGAAEAPPSRASCPTWCCSSTPRLLAGRAPRLAILKKKKRDLKLNNLNMNQVLYTKSFT